MKKCLLINAHQKYEDFAEGQLNQTMLDCIKEELEAKGYEMKFTIIEKEYDPVEEVKKHLWANLIITQSPVYWFGNPWIYKKYIDEVFNAGFFSQKFAADDGRTTKDPAKQYGSGGKMQGTKYMLSLTWNAPQNAFDDKEQDIFQGKSVDDAFISNTSVYKFCGVEILPAFSCFNVIKEADVENDLKRLKTHLNNLIG